MPRFAKREREIINARQVDTPLTVLTVEGEAVANEGDWIVNNGSELRIYKPDIFATVFEPLDGNPVDAKM